MDVEWIKVMAASVVGKFENQRTRVGHPKDLDHALFLYVFPYLRS